MRKILAGIARAGERYGRQRIVAMLRGDTKDLPPELSSLSTTGLLRHETADALRGWLTAAISAGLIAVTTDKYRTLSLTQHGRDVMRGRVADVRMRRPLRMPSLAVLRDDRDEFPFSRRAGARFRRRW